MQLENQVVKNTKFNTVKTKENKIDQKILDVITLTHRNQYITDKQNLVKKQRCG